MSIWTKISKGDICSTLFNPAHKELGQFWRQKGSSIKNISNKMAGECVEHRKKGKIYLGLPKWHNRKKYCHIIQGSWVWILMMPQPESGWDSKGKKLTMFWGRERVFFDNRPKSFKCQTHQPLNRKLTSAQRWVKSYLCPTEYIWLVLHCAIWIKQSYVHQMHPVSSPVSLVVLCGEIDWISQTGLLNPGT